MSKTDFDFAGYVTKNDILCDDGRTIKHGAFVDSGTSVPLVWNHDISTPENIIGNVELEHRSDGVYGYGKFMETPEALSAKASVESDVINAMSIRARNIREQGKDVIHGIIHEVSLVLRGANPGAFIDTIIAHSDDHDEEAIIYTGLSFTHSSENEEEADMDQEGNNETQEKTLEEVLSTFNEEQREAAEILISMGVDAVLNGELEDTDENEEGEGDGTDMKHNSFEQNGAELVHGAEQELSITANELLHVAGQGGYATLSHAAKEYGIANIDLLFPDAKLTDGVKIFEDKNTNVSKILGMIGKSPFSFVRTIIADLDAEYMRAKGYVTADRKVEDVFELLGRKITPTTIYKKQKLDRDDIIDITDVNVTNLVRNTMRPALLKEIVRAALIGDGREVLGSDGKPNRDKINPKNIIPIISDDDLYTMKYTVENVEGVLEAVMYALTEYQGEGTPAFFCSPTLAVAIKLAKTATGKYLFGDIPTLETMASKMGVSEIVPTSILSNNDIIITNLNDYQLGTSNGGEVTDFEQFDIDYNQYKFLIETRLSGGLTVPKSAIYMKVKEVQLTKPSILVEGITPSEAPEKGDLGQ